MSEEENNSRKKLKIIASHFQSIFECPVCFNILKCPFKWCINGHSICTECVNELEACPTCQAQFTTENTTLPLCVRNALEALPQSCCFSDAGCEDIVLQNDDHEKFCGFRPFHCKVPKCKVTLPLCALISHIDESHVVYKSQVVVNKTELVVEGNFDIKRREKFHTPVHFSKNWFWITAENNIEDQCLELTYYATPIGKPVVNHYVRVQFEKGNFFHCHTLRAYEISSSLITEFDDCHSKIDKNKEIFKMIVPFSILKYFIDKDSKLKCKYIFFTMPKEK